MHIVFESAVLACSFAVAFIVQKLALTFLLKAMNRDDGGRMIL